MRSCNIKIRTETDGNVYVFETEGEASFEGETATVRYADRDGRVRVEISDRVRICREGDYRLALELSQGKGNALIGFGTESGEIPVSVNACDIKISHSAIRFRAKYSLDFKEKQNMRLYFVALIKQETI